MCLYVLATITRQYFCCVCLIFRNFCRFWYASYGCVSRGQCRPVPRVAFFLVPPRSSHKPRPRRSLEPAHVSDVFVSSGTLFVQTDASVQVEFVAPVKAVIFGGNNVGDGRQPLPVHVNDLSGNDKQQKITSVFVRGWFEMQQETGPLGKGTSFSRGLRGKLTRIWLEDSLDSLQNMNA